MTQKNHGQDYVDPILKPGNLRKIVENLPGKAKLQSDYQYNNGDTDSFENEINEFFNHTQVIFELQDYRKAFHNEFCSKDLDHITTLLDRLGYEHQELRLQTCKLIAYFALGCFQTDQGETRLQRIDRVIQNNNLLASHGAFTIFFQRLQQSFAEYHESSSQKNRATMYAEMDVYITLIYLLMESQRHQYPSESSQKFKNELVTLELNLVEVLFSFLSKFGEDRSFPLKKTVLLLWKSLLFLSGGLESVKSLAMRLKESLGLDTKAAVMTKSTPQDLLSFQDEMTRKYPAYAPPNFPFKEASPLTVQASSSLAKAMGYVNQVENVELPYQTLFPPKTFANKKKNKQQHDLLQNYVSPAFPLPLSYIGSDVPQSITEAGNVYIANMHVSLANFQVIKERSKGIHKWQDKNGSTEGDGDDEKQALMEGLYTKILPQLQNAILVLVKLALTSALPQQATTAFTKNSQQVFNSSYEMATLQDLEEADAKRNSEIYSKSISGLLLVLLKWSKSSHVLKYEYISQLLADSGCMLFILKIIGLQQADDLVNTHTVVPSFCFFNYHINMKIANNEEKAGLNTHCRNMYWSINYLRILQMLTKHKPHRIMLLVQYKSTSILKKLLNISHPVLEQYVLKLIKSQVPYLGRKWKSQNMKLITAIYLNCKTVLQDDWICKLNATENVNDGKMEEQSLRILTRIYNGERYLPSLLPAHDEVNSTPSGPGFNGFQDYGLDQSIDYDCVDLDADFTQNYDAWLEAEVFNTTDDELDNMQPTQLFGCDTPIPSTPSPSHDEQEQFTPEELTLEINKLYIQELNAEFKPAIIIKEKPAAAQDKCRLPKKLTPLSRYDGTQGSKTYLRRPVSEPPEEEQRNEDWQMQTLDELMSRLLCVQEKAAEKWLSGNNHGGGSYHFKLFDQELYSSSEYYNTGSDDNYNDENDYMHDNSMHVL